ncbi:MAG: hypothetical protein ACLRSW_15425 [Christensenellaceae bacterium]
MKAVKEKFLCRSWRTSIFLETRRRNRKRCGQVRINPATSEGKGNKIRRRLYPRINFRRVGATGSIEPHFLKIRPKRRALVECLYNVGILEEFGVEDIVISVKASSVRYRRGLYVPSGADFLSTSA